MENDEPWYAAKTVYYHKTSNVYEERVVLHKAKDWDDAWDKNNAEVQEYIQSQEDIDSPIELVKTIEIYHLFDERIKSGSEVFSSMRRIHGSRSEYIKIAYEKGMNYRR